MTIWIILGFVSSALIGAGILANALDSNPNAKLSLLFGCIAFGIVCHIIF